VKELGNQKNISFTVALKKLKYLGIYLTKELTNLYNENYKSLKKEINKHQKIGLAELIL
jgi:hypothetical protein